MEYPTNGYIGVIVSKETHRDICGIRGELERSQIIYWKVTN